MMIRGVVALTLFCLALPITSEARVDLDCLVQYGRWVGGQQLDAYVLRRLWDGDYWSSWSKPYELKVSFEVGYEFGSSYRQKMGMKDSNLYASIWFSQDQVAIVDIGDARGYIGQAEGTHWRMSISHRSLLNWFRLNTVKSGSAIVGGIQVNQNSSARTGAFGRRINNNDLGWRFGCGTL